MASEPIDASTGQPVDSLRLELVTMIKARDAATPRHLQVELGPSEVAHPCMRKMAFGISEAPTCNPQFDPLPSIIGTAMHSWLDSAASHANMVAGRERWLTETKVHVAPGLSGSCDLYDKDTATVIDYKVVGTTRLTKYRKDPGPTYKGQVFLYGKGFENAGLPVSRVAIAFIPRGATLQSLHLWQTTYDPAIADAILGRREAVLLLMNDLDVEHHPERYSWIPIQPYDCRWCPWWRPDSRGQQTPFECNGKE